MANLWFVCHVGNETIEGPLAAEEIVRRILAREIDAAGRVCLHDGQSRWRPIADQEPFATAARELSSQATKQLPSLSPHALPPSDALRVEGPSAPVVSSNPRKLPGATRRVGARRALALGGVVLGVLGVAGAAIGLSGGAKSSHDTRVRQAMVHVVAGESGGAGFFVKGPDDSAYVVTAYHVIEGGNPVRVERMVDVSDRKSYVEAYPATEIVAADPDADLAVIRLKEVRGDKFSRLPLAKAPVKDEKIVAHGFPRSNLGKLESSISQEGKVNAITKFRVRDRVTNKHVRSNAIDGIIISAPLEPGFSGGPTVNERGEVVGVNVLKDLEHTQQNGAVSVEALAKLVASLKPASDPTPPSAADVKALLGRIEREYLKRPIADRMDVREAEFVSPEDFPHVKGLSKEVTDLFQNTTPDEDKLSGRARVGLVFAALPGTPLETYRSPEVRKALAPCPRHALSMFGAPYKKGKTDAKPSVDCDDYEKRALAWDLTVSALRWEGVERELEVTSVERVNDDTRAFKASVSAKGASTNFFVWVSTDQGKLRLKLFDDGGKPYWISAHSDASAGAFRGTWVYRGTPQRIPDTPIDAKVTETLSIDVNTEGTARVKHQFIRDLTVDSGRRWSCNGRSDKQIGVEQNFLGSLRDGVVWLFPSSQQKDGSPVIEPAGGDAPRCAGGRSSELGYSPDRVGILKLIAGRLFFYRTDGREFPEAIEFSR